MNRFLSVVLTALIPMFALAQTKVACVGNSITFGTGTWESAGISGDKTQNLLWRVRHGNYGSCKPDNVVIAIGVNNLLRGDAPEDVAEGIHLSAKGYEVVAGKLREIIE